MNFIRLHPFTLPFLIFMCIIQENFFLLYLFIFLHELAHFSACLILKEKCNCIHLLPWGCVLSLASPPSRKKSFFIFLAGPLFNFIMYFSGIFPKENLSLALFNLFPLMPLDGGMLTSLLFPEGYFFISLCSVGALLILCLYLKLFPFIPLLFLIVLFLGEKDRTNKVIFDKILHNLRQK